MATRTSFSAAFVLVSLGALAVAADGCSAGADTSGGGGEGAGGTNPNGGNGGAANQCPRCEFETYIDCDGNTINCEEQGLVCAETLGCAVCRPGDGTCIGNEVHECTDAGDPNGPVIEVCDVDAGFTCSEGRCKTACETAEEQSSNVGCEFWAVDLDQQDLELFNNPAAVPWGVALSNASDLVANVTIEVNNAAPGEPALLEAVSQVTVNPGSLVALELPTRELDCGAQPNDYEAPGTCVSSRAFRITASNPIIVYQFNVFTNAYSNDASLLIPSKALGMTYRVINWGAGHPIPIAWGAFNIRDRSYVTIVGTEPSTTVKVVPSWRIRGNPPIEATPAGGEITYVLNPFDVLNLETDDGTWQDDLDTIADLSGTAVYSDKPVAVFSGVESAGVPGPVEIPTYDGWASEDTCCLDHLEEQLFPVESIGTKYVIPRSPVRSTGAWREPDVIRFVGAAEVATVTTNLAAPNDTFTLQPGEVRSTWAQDNFVATSDKPFIVGQLLISQEYVDGQYVGDPSLTVFPPIDQFRTEYVILTPGSWSENWIVIVAQTGSSVTLDGNPTDGCTVEAASSVESIEYETRKCSLSEGVHSLTGDAPFGVAAYGYGSAGSYAFVGGADVKKIYEPPPPPQ